MRVAIIDNYSDHKSILLGEIVKLKYTCVVFRNRIEFLRSLRSETWDIVIVDIDFSDISGIDIVTLLKGKLGHTFPIIVIASVPDEIVAVKALNSGADDFISKPVSLPILLARINAVARRAGNRITDGPETFGEYVFHPGMQLVHRHGAPVQLTTKEFDLALMLFRRMHQPLSRAFLLEAVWGRNPHLPTRTLDAHVSRIRQKLQLRPEFGYRLSPVYSHGYRLENVEPSEVRFCA